MTTRPRVLYMGSDAASLRICVEACPTVSASSAGVNSSFCLPPTLARYITPTLANSSGLNARRCPMQVHASTAVLNRCTPDAARVPVEGWWVDAVASAYAAQIEMAAVGVVTMAIPATLLVQRAASVISISVTAAVCSGIAAMFMLIHSARVAGRESDSDPERARQVRAHEVVVAKVRGVPVLALGFPAAPSLLPTPACRARLSMYPHVTVSCHQQ